MTILLAEAISTHLLCNCPGDIGESLPCSKEADDDRVRRINLERLLREDVRLRLQRRCVLASLNNEGFKSR